MVRFTTKTAADWPGLAPARKHKHRGFEAVCRVVISAPRAKVWSVLTDPDMVSRWMHGTHLETDWEVGSPVTWSGEWQGRSYVDTGTVLEVDPKKRLRYTHWSPLGGSEDAPDNYHTVTYDLAGDERTTTLTLTQDNNATKADANKMAKDNWAPVLGALKAVAEGKPAA